MVQRNEKYEKEAPSTNSKLWISISISKDLLTNAINYASTITRIDKKVIDIIMHSRKSLLFSNNDIWVKKDNPYFDVTMGSFNGAEVCELVGLFLLNIVKGDFGGFENSAVLKISLDLSWKKSKRRYVKF